MDKKAEILYVLNDLKDIIIHNIELMWERDLAIEALIGMSGDTSLNTFSSFKDYEDRLKTLSSVISARDNLTRNNVMPNDSELSVFADICIRLLNKNAIIKRTIDELKVIIADAQ